MENATPKTARAKDDQYELAIRILAHYRDRNGGRGVQWGMINMPGRNLKSMQNIFTKINEDIKKLGIDASPVASSAPATSGKKRGRAPSTKAKKLASQTGTGESDDEEDMMNTPSKPPPRKRVAKTEPPSDEAPTESNIKQEVQDFEQGLIKSDLEDVADAEA